MEDKFTLNWCKKIVRNFAKEKGLTRLNIDDLISAGCLGYAQALNRYDPEKGSFPAYARMRIKGAVLDEVRKIIGDERNKKKRPGVVLLGEHDVLLSDGGYAARQMEARSEILLFYRQMRKEWENSK